MTTETTAQDAGAKKDKAPTIKTTTLAEQGANMPVGIRQHDGSAVRGFTVRPWRMKEEKELAAANRDIKNSNLAMYVSNIIAHMCPQLGPHNLDAMKPAERSVVVSQMLMADIWFVYSFIRRDALGDHLKLQLNCPKCRTPFPFTASLGTLEVKVPSSLDDAMYEFKLNKAIQIRGKKVESLRLGPQRWNVIEQVYAHQDEGKIKEAALRSSVYGLNADQEQVQLIESDLDMMGKLDIERMSAAIDENYIGPNMAIELDKNTPCAKCGFNEVRRLPIDWKYESFFGVSSH